jgi:hypothetical protein
MMFDFGQAVVDTVQHEDLGHAIAVGVGREEI